MTADDFRRIALSLPEASEGSHMGHPDFRVKGKIFATLFWASEEDERERGMVKLTPELQEELMEAHPRIFEPVKGGWGRQGCTQVHLEAAGVRIVRNAMAAAWRRAAPKTLAAAFDAASMK